MKNKILITFLLALCLGLSPGLALADDFADYKTAAGTTGVVDLPTVAAGWFVAVDAFPAGTAEVIDGKFEAKGRMIAANNHEIYIQRTYGSSQWDLVATVPGSLPMDPSFIHVSPDGSKIALGIGFNAPLVIIPTDALSVSNPQSVFDMTNARVFESIVYYDADWVDNQYLVVNGGNWPTGCDEPYIGNPNCVFQSGVGAVDTETTDNPADHLGQPLIFGIPGASSDVDVDSDGNLLTGLGYAPGDPNRTGELKVWDDAEWDPVHGSNLLYDDNAKIVAANLLSLAGMGQDAEGNFHAGGGDAFGSGGADENGYAALIKAGVVSDIAEGIRSTPLTDGNKSDNSEYKYFAPDPCQDDSSTGILAGDWGRGLAVMWNPSGDGIGGCAGAPGSATDYWLTGVTPRLTIYYPGSALDTDGDGIPDASDNAYLTANPGQEDTDGDGYGNAADADFNNDALVDGDDFTYFSSRWDSSDPDADMNADGLVDGNDFNEFSTRWDQAAPYY